MFVVLNQDKDILHLIREGDQIELSPQMSLSGSYILGFNLVHNDEYIIETFDDLQTAYDNQQIMLSKWKSIKLVLSLLWKLIIGKEFSDD